MTSIKTTVKVWDPLIRIGHWTLVAAFVTAYLTEEDSLTLHVWAGYTVGAYLVFRILWGFIGIKYARFGNFIYAPAKVAGYLRNLLALRPQHYTGHNPAGGAMVLALLLSLAATTVTGLKLYAVDEGKGPLALSDRQIHALLVSVNPIPAAKAGEDDDKSEERSERRNKPEKNGQEEFWKESHEFFANLTLLLVLVHVGGVIASSRIDKENLVKAMFTGKKEIDDSYQ